MDVGFVEKEVVATFTEPERIAEVQQMIGSIRRHDTLPPEPKVAGPEIIWPIGHVFQHRLFGYIAVVRGWDKTCEAGDTCKWVGQHNVVALMKEDKQINDIVFSAGSTVGIEAMQVDSLPYGRHQPFYHVVGATPFFLLLRSVVEKLVPPDHRGWVVKIRGLRKHQQRLPSSRHRQVESCEQPDGRKVHADRYSTRGWSNEVCSLGREHGFLFLPGGYHLTVDLHGSAHVSPCYKMHPCPTYCSATRCTLHDEIRERLSLPTTGVSFVCTYDLTTQC